ncbi:hypothetical protein DICVIV_04084 [Dictyocaulus viviparus]|uniref:Uncharacterized protein n=1 Tax=Dictyocaulus viviparus TaxID=29172 RepID=A0A0D8Y136_DICVI|nr:hypothetical protein DICVIV_04084 [Dictyocaulus viviparus]
MLKSWLVSSPASCCVQAVSQLCCDVDAFEPAVVDDYCILRLDLTYSRGFPWSQKIIDQFKLLQIGGKPCTSLCSKRALSGFDSAGCFVLHIYRRSGGESPPAVLVALLSWIS